MMGIYAGGAVGLFLMGQQSGGGMSLLEQALNPETGMGGVVDDAMKVATLGVQPVDAAVIVALSGLGWKFLDANQKGGTIDTLNLWLRKKLNVGDKPPPA